MSDIGLSRLAALDLIRRLVAAEQYSIEPHAKEGMTSRDITMRQVMATLGEGSINQGPTLDECNDWRCRLRKRTAGRLVRVVVAIHDMSFLYVISVH